MMEEQLKRSNAEIEGIERMKQKVEEILIGLGQAKLADGISDDKTDPQTEGEDDEDMAIWDELEKEFG